MKVIHGSYPGEHPAPAQAQLDPPTAEYKTCPICGSVCFIDMDVCFGCLHHFEDDEIPMNVAPQTQPDGSGQGGDGVTSRHVCSGKDGQQFEITISVKML